jgi:hypothetical protein
MKPIVTSVEELYGRREATGEVLLDEMVNCLRRTRIIAVADLAALMDVNAHQLNMAVRLLTGMTTRDVINWWRLLQAQDMLRQGMTGEAKDGFGQNATGTERPKRLDGAAKQASKDDRIRLLNAVARRCGWRSYRVLLKVAHRYGVKLEIL